MSAWWTEAAGTYIGAYGGAGIGVAGGLYGAVGGILAQKGKARSFVLGAHLALLALGAVTLVAGIVAVIADQPRYVWYPLCLIGGILTAVMGPMFPAIKQRYAEADQRRIEAEQIRRA
ncbi:MAG: hypothetical protein ACYTGN_12385 [Planctomycetota bacterium]|jgi:hypothetical protein